MIKFEWDPTKASSNLADHGVSFPEAATAFADAFSLTIFDPEHSETEDRFVLLGMSAYGRLLVVSHTERSGTIRLISARTANRKERIQYEAKQ